MDYNDVPLMRVPHLNKCFDEDCPHCRSHSIELQGNYCPKCGTAYARRDISSDVYDREIPGVAGENGSDKPTMMQYLYFDQEVTGGSCVIRTYKNEATNISELAAQQQRYIHSHAPGMVYQNPHLGLKMNFSSMGNIAEELITAGKYSVKAMNEHGEELLSAMKIPVHRIKEESRKSSDGMQQCIQIVKVLSNNPPILLPGKVITRPDLSAQASVLDPIREIQRELEVSMLVVSRDLGVTRTLADRTTVILDGEIIEQGLTDQVTEDSRHPYTQQFVYLLLQGEHHNCNYKWGHRTGVWYIKGSCSAD